MQCGTCQRCGQSGKLGYLCSTKGGEAFNCGACIDRYCDDSDEDMAPCVDERHDNLTSICSRMDVPEKLSDVPDGRLEYESLVIHPGDDPKLQETFCAVADPENNLFMGHGAAGVWPAAKLLTKYLLTQPLEGLNIVELGAGCGIPGIAAARHGAHVTLTDLPWVLPLTGYNIEANFAPADPQRPKLAPLRWGSKEDASALVAKSRPDIVIGADVVYRDDELKLLLKTIAELGANEVILTLVRREDILSSFSRTIANCCWHEKILGFEDSIAVVRVFRDSHGAAGA